LYYHPTQKMQSPTRTTLTVDDALIYLAYEDAAYCVLLLVTAKHGLTLDSHEVLKVWSKCKVAAKDTKMPSEALQKEAARIWDELGLDTDRGGWRNLVLIKRTGLLGRNCYYYNIPLYD